MHSFPQVLALTAFTLSLVTAQPVEQGRRPIHRRQDYNNLPVDWSKVNYGSAGAAPPAPAPAPPAPSPKAAAADQEKDVVKVVTAPGPEASPAKKQQQNPPQQGNPAPSSGGSTGGSSSSGGKRGLAYNPSSPSLDIFNSYSDLAWAYNWDSDPGSNFPSSKYQYVPLLFSGEDAHTGSWKANVAKAPSQGSTKYLMSFNEPDQDPGAGGSSMTVGQAVSSFQQWMLPYAAEGYQLGAPAVSNSALGNQGLVGWLAPFLKQCSNCQISFVPVHWYGCNPASQACPGGAPSDITSFKQHVTDSIRAAKFNGKQLPIWITEFQCQTDPDAFMAEILPWLESQSGVARYSYFMVGQDILANGASITPLGQKYGST